jgi:hypothetical protein
MRTILQTVDSRRLDRDVQDRLSEKDCTHHFHAVNIAMFCDVLEAHGYPHYSVDQALLEVFAARNDYAFDTDFQAFMAGLLHVKYDLTPTASEDVAGLQPGDKVPVNLRLHSLDGTATTLGDHLHTGRRTVVVAGSWS